MPSCDSVGLSNLVLPVIPHMDITKHNFGHTVTLDNQVIEFQSIESRATKSQPRLFQSVDTSDN